MSDRIRFSVTLALLAVPCLGCGPAGSPHRAAPPVGFTPAAELGAPSSATPPTTAGKHSRPEPSSVRTPRALVPVRAEAGTAHSSQGSRLAKRASPGRASAETFGFLGWRTAHAEWMEPSSLFNELARADLICLAVDDYDAVAEAAVRLLIEEGEARAAQSGRLQRLALALPPLDALTARESGRPNQKHRAWLNELLGAGALTEGELPHVLAILAQAHQFGIPVVPVGNPRFSPSPTIETQNLNRSSVFPERVLQIFSTESPAPQLLLLASHRDCSNDGWLRWVAAGSSLIPLSVGLDRAGPLDPEQPLPSARIDPTVDYQIVILPGS